MAVAPTPPIYHERQQLSRCAVHAVNNLLGGPVYSARVRTACDRVGRGGGGGNEGRAPSPMGGGPSLHPAIGGGSCWESRGGALAVMPGQRPPPPVLGWQQLGGIRVFTCSSLVLSFVSFVRASPSLCPSSRTPVLPLFSRSSWPGCLSGGWAVRRHSLCFPFLPLLPATPRPPRPTPQDFDAICEELNPSRWADPHRYVPAGARSMVGVGGVSGLVGVGCDGFRPIGWWLCCGCIVHQWCGSMLDGSPWEVAP